MEGQWSGNMLHLGLLSVLGSQDGAACFVCKTPQPECEYMDMDGSTRSKFLTSQENSFHRYLLNKFQMRSLNDWTSVQGLRGVVRAGFGRDYFGRGPNEKGLKVG